MKAVLDCLPCYLKQAVSAARAGTGDPDRQEAAVKAAAAVIPELPMDVTPAENSWRILKAVNQSLGCDDPFAGKKSESNRLALKLLPWVQEILDQSEDKLLAAVKLAAAGNIIDMGILPDFDVEKSIKQAFSEDLAINDYDLLQEALPRAQEILYLGDNSGEIAFDTLLVRELGRFGRVTFAVKGGPILNDATRQDAHEVGMDRVAAEVVDNGNDGVGTVLKRTSPEFRRAFAEADLILSKGQANFETLDGVRAPIFFLLRAKCDCLAAYLQVPVGKAVLIRQNP